MFVVFLLHHDVAVGLCCRGVRGVNGAVERRHAAPAVVGRLLVHDKGVSGFAGHGWTTKPGSF